MEGFGFSKTQDMFRRQVRRFVQGDLKATSRERATQWSAQKSVLKSTAKIGLLGMQIPKEFRGQDSGWLSFGIAVEELGRGSVADGLLPAAAHQIVAPLLAARELAQEWLPAIVAGDKTIAFAITDPRTASDPSAIELAAQSEGGQYVLNGTQSPYWLAGGADAIVAIARTNPEAGANGLTAFLVPASLPGIAVSQIPSAGLRSYGPGAVSFESVRLQASYRLGEEGQGISLAANGVDVARVSVALASLGAAGASLEEAIEYAKERTAFGQPLARFEAISFKIVEHMTRVEAARMLCYKTLSLMDQALPHSIESSMSHWHSCEVASDAIHDALLVFGNLGYSEELPFAQRLKDVLGCAVMVGTGESSRNLLVREIIGQEYLP